MQDYTDTHQNIALYLSGDSRALEELIRSHTGEIYRLALAILGDPAEAQDAVQDTFIAMVNHLGSYQHRCVFKAWLFTITVNTCRSRLRKTKSLARLRDLLQGTLNTDPRHSVSAEEQAMQKDRDSALWKAVGSLADRQRIPLILRHFNDLSVSEIAQVLDLPEGTVHSRLHFARQRLRSLLEKRNA